MLQITDLTYRIEGRALFDSAAASVAKGWKVGLVGRNGAGKSTLLRLIREENGRGDASIRIQKRARLGFVAQEAAPTRELLLDVVLAADAERAALMAEAETATDPHRIADIHTRLFDIDAHSAEARAAEILCGLGFTQDDLARPIAEFSGGWRMRAALGGVLFATPDLLLLDEPTNYLDLEGASWLEGHIRRYPNTVVIVSHDRAVLNRSVTHIMALDHGKLSVHAGDYETYLRKKAEKAALLTGMKAKQDNERARLQAFVDRFRAKASKARQAQSRVKMLEKMQEIILPIEERTTPFHFESPAELASPLLQLEDADLGYAPGAPVLRGVSLRVDSDDRVAIVGSNGQGKTTLVKSIAAKLELLAGSRVAPRAVRIGYFSQDQLDELRAGETPLDHVRDFAPDAPQAKLRALAAQLGFGREKIDTKVESLSGGEKVRLLLGLTALTRPHILILDEPTSHLDIDSREALIYALNDYKGAVLLITHDVYLAEACADRLWLVNQGRAAPYDGDLGDYRALVMAADRSPRANPVLEDDKTRPGEPRRAGDARQRGKVERAAAPETRAATTRGEARGSAPGATPFAAPAARTAAARPTAPLRKRVEKAEADLDAARAALEAIDRELADPDVAAGPTPRAAALGARRAILLVKITAAEEDWLEASAALEARTG